MIPPISDEFHGRLRNLVNQHELTTEVAALSPKVSEIQCEVAPQPFKFILLKAQVFNEVLNIFPSLNPLFPREDRTKLLLELNGFSFGEFFGFIAAMIEKMPGREVKTQICALTNELNGSEKNRA